MELCGIPLTKPSKDKTREDLETLYSISLEQSVQSGNRAKEFSKMRICDKIAIIKAKICFGFSPDMTRYLTNSDIMQYPIELLQEDERKETGNIISVKALIEMGPNIPYFDKISKEGRQLDQRIKTPFEKALNALDFISWEYANSKEIALSDAQIAQAFYSDFENLYIKFNAIGLHNQILKTKNKKGKTSKSGKN